MRERLTGVLEDLLGSSQGVRGTLRIGLFLGFSRFRLADAVGAFVRKHPAARVRVSIGPQTWLIEQLLAGKLDMTLSLEPTAEQTARIRSQRIIVRPLVLVLRKRWRSLPRDFSELCALPIVDYYESDPLIDRWTRHHFGARRIPRERIRAFAASTDLALELVMRGVGAAVIPEDFAASYQHRKQLAVTKGPRRPLMDPLWLNELGGVHVNRAVAAFRELLLERLGDQSSDIG
jgi:DNA-binding transcriptional LysR family regulator